VSFVNSKDPPRSILLVLLVKLVKRELYLSDTSVFEILLRRAATIPSAKTAAPIQIPIHTKGIFVSLSNSRDSRGVGISIVGHEVGVSLADGVAVLSVKKTSFGFSKGAEAREVGTVVSRAEVVAEDFIIVGTVVLRSAEGPAEGVIVDNSPMGNEFVTEGASVRLLLPSSSSSFGDGAAVACLSKIPGSGVEGLVVDVVQSFFRKGVGS